MARKKEAVCDLDCFNCKFEDCINDILEAEDYEESQKLDNTIMAQRRQKNARKMSLYAKNKKKEYFTEDRENEKAYARAYYSLNRERLLKYRMQNKDRKSAYDRRYFKQNREKISKKNKIYGLKNKEHLRERQKQWREKNRDKIKAYQREYYLRKKQQKNAPSD